MSANDYFPIYIETIAQAFRRIRKIGFKKFNQVKDLLDTVENFLSKQVYGRIEPANYLLALIVVLGSRTPKLYPPIVSAIQRLFSYNFINPNEDLLGSLKLIREEHREFLLLPLEDYSSRSFKEIYIETLVSLGERDDGLNLSVAKSLSLIWRLDQNSIPVSLLPKIFDFLIECMGGNKLQEDQKMLKSVILQMFRHALESYREVYDRRFLQEENSVSIKGVCRKYGLVLADSVAIKLDLFIRRGISNYQIVPSQDPAETFELCLSEESNEKGIAAGKFGWCTICRSAAQYYCRNTRLPVCSYECKQALVNQFQSLQKFTLEEQRSAEVFESHIRGLFALFRKYLGHSDVKKRISFSEIFVLMASQIKKVADKLTPKAYLQLRGVVRQVMANIYAETQTFLQCMASLKKLLVLRIFLDETEIVLRMFARKLVYFLTPQHVKDEILKFVKDMINNRLLFDAAIALDCCPDRYDSVKEVIDAMRQLYIGIPIPEAITVPPLQDLGSKRLSMQVALILLRSLQQTDKKIIQVQSEKAVAQKNRLNGIRANIERFNKTEKPLKVVKKLIEEGFLAADAHSIAKFIHENLRRLNPTNVGVLIGDIDEFAGQIRREYIGQMNFSGFPIDEGMRILLRHFTLPGESQVVERIVETFGITYFEQNKQGGVLVNSDAVYSLSYLLMMLQSNLHNPQVVDKMTLPQFAKLSKGMNGSPDAQFPADFLQAIYLSVQKTPLGVHERLKQIQIAIAYSTNPKKAQQIYLKQQQRIGLEFIQKLQEGPVKSLTELHRYPLAIFVDEFVSQIIDMLAWRIKDLEDKDKQQLLKCLQLMQGAIRSGSDNGVVQLVQRGVQKIWQQIQRSTISKKYLLMQAMFEWVRKYGEKITHQWKVVVFLISKFNRSKSVRKDQSANKGQVSISIVQNKCYLYDSYIESLMGKAAKFALPNLIGFLRALLVVSRDEINDGGVPFCLQKINQVLQLNANRSLQILTIFWSELREYYTQLGRHKTQRIAMFAADFLKQLVTKFLKRKDLITLQREYLRPFEEIFLGTKIFAVKELMIGGLNYFVSNHYPHLKSGWKTVLSVVCNCFEEEEHQVIKEKAYAIIKRISDNNFTIFNLDENYTDFVQILSRLAREKEQTYALGCLQIIKEIIEYYHKQLGIDLQRTVDSPENAKLNINFWQTIFLPLLSIIFPICGDSRTNIQLPAIESLFDILVRYGKFFKYEFWKMVLQGVLRPAFEEITYTSQSKPLKKNLLQNWLKNSFTLLFKSINQLIVLYYEEFRLFLEDVFKIYQNCILNHSLKLLIMLSLDALNDLLQKIAPNFEQADWQTYLLFAQSLLKKTLPTQIGSIEAWTRSKDMLQNNYEAKCFALFLFLNKSQEIFQKFPNSITEKIYLDVLKELQPIYTFVTAFNENIELRDALWKKGFYQDIKILPGLIKHHFQVLRFKSKIYFQLISINPSYLQQYFRHVSFIFEKTKELRNTEHLKEPSPKDYERERINSNYKFLLLDTVLEQLFGLGAQTLIKTDFGQKLLELTLQLLGNRVYCTRCQACQSCDNNAETTRRLNESLQKLVLLLFKAK